MSTQMPWFRMYVDFLNDPKLISLAFEDQRHFVGVLALKSDGALDNACDPDLLDRIVAQRLWIDHAIIRDVKKRLVAAGLIDTSWQPLDWQRFSPKSKPSDRPIASVWRVIRDRIFLRDNYTCQYCGARGGRLECDHKVPVALGVGHDDSNLATACFACNRSKRDKLISEWRRA